MEKISHPTFQPGEISELKEKTRELLLCGDVKK